MITQKLYTILRNEKIAPLYYCLAVKAPQLAKKALSGQFVSLLVNEKNLLLRRPFGVFDCDKDVFRLVYKVVGRGTAALTKLAKGDDVDILGLLGNGFAVKRARRHLIVGGGVGISPLFYLAKKIGAPPDTRVFLGGRSKGDLICEKDFKALGCVVAVATEDGTKGKKGLVTGLLDADLRKHGGDGVVVYACGPKGMLKAVAGIAAEYGAACQVSLEEYMACGIGTCMGCVIKIRNEKAEAGFEYRRVCKEGPVFSAEEIIWD
ncbi:MAG TPA: dihydroorotate dehydrogenase electron transfer subunit [bacterium]|nr:dihydroorotate dehydrogenase electron transfer subunit [bacterium]